MFNQATGSEWLALPKNCVLVPECQKSLLLALNNAGWNNKTLLLNIVKCFACLIQVLEESADVSSDMKWSLASHVAPLQLLCKLDHLCWVKKNKGGAAAYLHTKGAGMVLLNLLAFFCFCFVQTDTHLSWQSKHSSLWLLSTTNTLANQKAMYMLNSWREKESDYFPSSLFFLLEVFLNSWKGEVLSCVAGAMLWSSALRQKPVDSNTSVGAHWHHVLLGDL